MLTELGTYEELGVRGILIEPLTEDEFDTYCDRALFSEAMDKIEAGLRSYGIEVEFEEGYVADAYRVANFNQGMYGVKVDFEFRTHCKSGELSGLWSESPSPILDVSMYCLSEDSPPLAICYLRKNDIVYIEYDLGSDGNLFLGVFALGGKEGYITRDRILDFFRELPK